MKTLVVGHVTHDRYEEGFVAGGCALYGALVHQRLADEVHLVTAVGEDFVCDEAIESLDRTITRRGETTVFTNLYPEEGPRVQLLDAQGKEVEPRGVPEAWLEADLVHLAPVLGEVDLKKWKEAVGDGLLAINIQGWIKVGEPGDSGSRRVIQKPWEVSGEQLQGVDIACLSEEDIIGQGDLLERLVKNVPIVALTLGGRGSRIYVNGWTAEEVGIYPTEVVDPTGAGDVFAATFCNAVVSGVGFRKAARLASAAASIIIEDIGPGAMDRLNEMEERSALVESFRE